MKILLLFITVAFLSCTGYAQRTKERLDENWNSTTEPDKAVYFRIVQSMPAWKAGIQYGQPVKVSFALPVKFSL